MRGFYDVNGNKPSTESKQTSKKGFYDVNGNKPLELTETKTEVEGETITLEEYKKQLSNRHTISQNVKPKVVKKLVTNALGGISATNKGYGDFTSSPSKEESTDKDTTPVTDTGKDTTPVVDTTDTSNEEETENKKGYYNLDPSVSSENSVFKDTPRIATKFGITPVSQWKTIEATTKDFVVKEKKNERDMNNLYSLITLPTSDLEAMKTENAKKGEIRKTASKILNHAEKVEQYKGKNNRYADLYTKASLDRMISANGYSSLDEVKRAYEENNPNVAYVMSDGEEVTWDDIIHESKLYDFEKVTQNQDFEEKSAFKKKNVEYRTTSGYYQNIPITTSTISKGTEAEHIYNLVNGDEDALGYNTVNNVAVYNTLDETKNEYLYENEKKIFNYLWETKGAETALSYLDLLNDSLQARRNEQERLRWEQYAKENPTKATIGEILASPFTNTLSGVATLGDYIDDGKIDENSAIYTHQTRKNTVYDTVRSNIDSPVGKFFYNVGTNIGEQGMAMLIGSGNKFITLGTQVAGGFGNTVIDAKKRGLSDNQAFALGIISATAEIYFESKSFDALFDSKGLLKQSRWQYYKNNLKTEIPGELFTELVNDSADTLIGGDLSQWSLSIKNYMANGMTEEEAFKATSKDFIYKYTETAGVTFVSTSVMSGTPMLFDYTITKATENSDIGKEVRKFFDENYGKDVTSDYIKDTLKFYPPDSNVYKLATEAQGEIDAGKEVSDKLLGKIYRASVEQNNKKAETKTDETTDNKTEDVTAKTTPVTETTTESAEQTTPVESTAPQTPVAQAPVTQTPTPVEETVESNTVASNETVDNTVPTDTTPAVKSVSVGDTFTDSKYGNTITVVDRNDKHTIIAIDNGKKVTTRQYSNEQADNLIADNRYVPVATETPTVPITENVETPVATTVVENAENSTEVLKNPNEGDIVNTTVEVGDTTTDSRTENITDEAEVGAGELSYNDFTLDKTKHTQTGEELWVIRPIERVENFKELQSKMKSLGGYYSRFANTPHGKGGFVFKTDPFNLFVKTQEVETDGNIEGHDSIGTTQLRENNQNGVHPQGSNRTVEENTSDSERGQGGINRSNKEEYDNRDFQRGIVRNVFHGTPYNFTNHEKSYVDLGIHFGNEEQAKTRLSNGQGNILQRDLQLENPLVTQDIFGERTPEQYVTELLEKSELSNSEKEVLKKAFDNFLKSNIEKEAKTSLKDKLNNGKYQIKTKVTQEGVVVSLTIVDDSANINEIPLAELIDKNKMLDVLGVDNTFKILKNGISETDANAIYDCAFDAVVTFEIQYLKLREIENILKSFGYDGFAYRNENEGEGWSYAVFDNEQILNNGNGAGIPTELTQNKLKSSETKSDEQTPTQNQNAHTEQNNAVEKESAENVQKPSVLDGESRTDDRGLQSETSESDGRKGNETIREDGIESSGEVLPTDTVEGRGHQSDNGDVSEGERRRTDRGTSEQEAEGTDQRGRGERGRVERTGLGTDGRVYGVDTESVDEAPEVIETVDKSVEKKRPSNKGNFVITNDVAEELDNNYPSAEDNIEAIELLLKIESEGRTATADEKKILAKYKGWGGIDIRRIDWRLSQRLNDLYDYDQRRSMQDSSLNAYFTPTKVIDAMYNGLKQMGFKGGNVLETSMGIGNFFGRMPLQMCAKSALTGVELESYTARIAQMLYSGATVINKPFQDVVIKNDSYDLVIGNVPFGNEKLSYNGKKHSLHNYFILSSLDKVREGGIVAVITSAGTLDNYSIDARSAMMDKADVVACYKLPEGVFSRNAKTDVQSDLLILRKRAKDSKPVGDSILNVTEKDGLRINEYFVKHPENVLGTLAEGSNAWGKITTVLNDGSFDKKLSDAMKKLPKNIMNGESELKPVDSIIVTESKPRFFEKDGKIYQDDGAGEATAVTRNVDTIKDYIAVRDAYKSMLDAYNNKDLPEAEIKPLRDTLNKAYDNFFKKHTAISGDGKKKIDGKKCNNNGFLEADSDYYLLCGLERYNKKAGKFEKSEVFERDTIRKKKVTSVNTSSEALAVSLNETGGIDFKVMSELTGKSEKVLAEELKGEIVYTPQGTYELIDVYLSGDIYAKLEEVKGKPEFREQEEMLKKVLPTPKDASEITVKLGANYIDANYIQDFAREVFGERITVKKNSAGNWVIDGAEARRYGALVNSKYGCDSLNAIQLLQRLLNDADIVCKKTVQNGDQKISVFDKEMTDIALGKAEDIKTAFENWIFKDGDRRNNIVDKYNRTYNAFRPLDYTQLSSLLTFETMNPSLRGKLYPHQKKGIARFLFGGNTLFAHGVGTGKTFEMIASAMEAKAMGLINKTAMVVPNNKVVDFKKDILEAYPNAKVLVVDTTNKKRQSMLGLVNSNDWDIILIARTTFTKIPVSPEMQKSFYNSQIEALNREIAEAESDRYFSGRAKNSLIKQRQTLENKLKELDKATDRDTGVDFEQLGIDCIVVDEAHNYKSVTTPSKLKIKGLVNKSDAQQANDMLMKLDYLRSIDGKIIFGTGTPITNTVSEIYNMIRMVRPDILEDAGIHSLDEWVNTFAQVDSGVEIDIDGTIKDKPTKSIRSFINTKEMVAMFRQFADIVFTKDVVKDLPKAINHAIEIDGTPEHKLINQAVRVALESASGTGKLGAYGTASGMLNASAVDLRMLSGVDKESNPLKDYSLEELEYENSKVNTMCGYIMQHYNESQDIKGTQIIFCDGGAGSGTTYTFNVHKDIKEKLVKLGIPENEVVIIKNQNDSQLEELYAQVNSGEVRVLIGTSAKMAEGLNVQERVVAIHHPTVSYKPSDLEQSDARGVRKGNINSEVHIYRYLQGDTFDAHKWQAIDRKGEMINNALRGDDVGVIEDIGADEDGGADIDPATAMAITSGNPLVKSKIDIDKKVNSLLTVKKNYQSEIYKYQDIIAKYPQGILQTKALAEKTKQDIALRDKNADTKTLINGKAYEKQGDANNALVEAVKKAPKKGEYVKIGEYNGFDIMFKGETGGLGYGLLLRGSNDYTVEYVAQGNTMARFAGVLNRLEKTLENYQTSVERMTKDLETARQEVNKPFEREAELEKALAEQKQITYDYEHYSDPEVKAKYEQQKPNVSNDSEDDVSYDKTTSDGRWQTSNVESDSEEGVALDNIVKKINKHFGVPAATGKVPKDARGVYKQTPEVIRTGITNNVPTISHELGHHLDKLYSLSKLDSVNSLVKAEGVKEHISQYPPDKQKTEAVAEFVRTYLKSKNEAKNLSPAFYNNFINTLSKKDMKFVNEIASDFNRYLSMSTEDKYKSSISDGKSKPKRRKLSYFYTKVVAQFYPIKEVTDFVEEVTGETLVGSKNAYVLAENSLTSKQRARFLVADGFTNLNGDIINEKSLIECIEKVKTKDLMTFAEYLVLKHSVELHEYGVRSFGDDILQDPDTMLEEIARIESEHPEMIQASENLYQFQRNMLKYYLVDSGLISQSLYNTLVEKYPCYVPFYRDLSNKVARTGHGFGKFANIKSPIKRIKGSGAPIINPIKSIIENTEKFVRLSLENQAWGVLTSYAHEVDGFGQFVEKVTPDMQPHTTDMTAYKENLTKRLQETLKVDDFLSVTSLLDEIIGNTITNFTPKANASKGIVTVMRNGQASYYQVHDTELYNAIINTSPERLSGIVRFIGWISRAPKTLYTTFSHTFGARNPIRDFRAYYVRSESNNPLTITADYFKAIWSIISKDESYKQWKAMGGNFGDKISADMNQLKRMLRDVKMKDRGKATRLLYTLTCHPLQIITNITSFSESIPRVADFKRQRALGKDTQDAIHSANDITNNWNRRGNSKSMQSIDKVIYFNNAAIQGLDSTIRHATGKNWKGYWGKTITFAIFMTALQRFFNKDDEEEYERLSSYTKNNNYVFSMGDGEFISIPKSREVSIPDSFIERIVDYAFGDEDAFYDFGGYLADNILPPMISEHWLSLDVKDAIHDTAGSTILGGLTDIGFNQDYQGRPIESSYEQNYLESWERYDESTSKIAYWLGQTPWARNHEYSPKQIDHLLSNYLGSIGTVAQAHSPMDKTRTDIWAGLGRAFVKDSVYSTDILNKLWDASDEAEKQFKWDNNVDNAVEYESKKIVTDYMSNMLSAINELPMEERRDGRKFLIENLENWENPLTKSQEEMQIELAGMNIESNVILELPPSVLDWSETDDYGVKHKYVYQLTPEEYDSYVKEILKNVDIERSALYQYYLDKDGNLDVDSYLYELPNTISDVKKAVKEDFKYTYEDKCVEKK